MVKLLNSRKDLLHVANFRLCRSLDLRAASCCTWASAKFWSKFWTCKKKDNEKDKSWKPQKRSGVMLNSSRWMPCLSMLRFPCELPWDLTAPVEFSNTRSHEAMNISAMCWSCRDAAMPGQFPSWMKSTYQWPETASLRCLSVNCHLNSSCMLYFTFHPRKNHIDTLPSSLLFISRIAEIATLLPLRQALYE